MRTKSILAMLLVTATVVVTFGSNDSANAGLPLFPGVPGSPTVNVRVDGYLPAPPGVNVQIDSGRPYYVERERRVYIEREPVRYVEKRHYKKYKKHKKHHNDHDDHDDNRGRGKHNGRGRH